MSKSILILNLTRMGDLIQSTPLMVGLRRKHPDAVITLVVGSDFAEFARYIPHVDRIIVFNLRQFKDRHGNPDVNWVEVYRYIEQFLNDLRRDNFDLLINLSHSKLSALMTAYLKIRDVCGFSIQEEGQRKTNHPWMQYFGIVLFNRIYNTFNLVDIFTRSGDIVPQGAVSLLPVADEGLTPAPGANELVVGLQVGSSLEDRRWSADSFATLADLLAEHCNARILIFGVASESATARQVIDRMKYKERATDLTGKTGIPQLIGWVKRCDYLVTNDTGTMHIAAAVGTRIVGLFFAHAHPHETGPYGVGHVLFQARIPCAPCSYGVHCGNIVCIRTVTSNLLFAMIRHHRESGQWRVPKMSAGLGEVDIYETEFDSDHFLRLRPLIQRPMRTDDVFRHAYRELWRRSLASGDTAAVSESVFAILDRDFSASNREEVCGEVRSRLSRFADLCELAQNGKKAADAIIGLAKMKKDNVASKKIQALGGEIETIDEGVNMLGLAYPEVKPLVDMFNKRKENLEGEDVAHLAQASAGIYASLQNEAALIQRLLGHTGDTSERRPDSNFTSVYNSINVAVPGK